MSKDYGKYSDYELESEYDTNPNDDVYHELHNRGYEEVDGELLDEYEYDDYLEEQDRDRDGDSGGTLSGIGCLGVIAIIIGLFVNPSGTWEVVKTIFMIIAYVFLKIVEFIFSIGS